MYVYFLFLIYRRSNVLNNNDLKKKHETLNT